MKRSSGTLFLIFLITLVSVTAVGSAFPISAPGGPPGVNIATRALDTRPGDFGLPDVQQPPRSRVPGEELRCLEKGTCIQTPAILWIEAIILSPLALIPVYQ
ncbi:MAG: hypothetical protein JOS17DRAFT_785673 [Linnemannia elongata]|nr:MAG: hypothetical protein JOS17DRAFT_785673 [Linnemannia elongata]